MAVFWNEPDFDDHELIELVHDRASGLTAIVAIRRIISVSLEYLSRRQGAPCDIDEVRGHAARIAERLDAICGRARRPGEALMSLQMRWRKS